MTPKPAEGSSPDPPPSPTPASSETAAQERAGERTGPLAVERLEKDDGRVLILFTSTADRDHGA